MLPVVRTLVSLESVCCELQKYRNVFIALSLPRTFTTSQLVHASSRQQVDSSSSSTPQTSNVHNIDNRPVSKISKQAPNPGLAAKLLSEANKGVQLLKKERCQSIMQEFQRAPGDTGSPEVQVAIMTERIRVLSQHTIASKKDNTAKRGLQGLLNQRRKLLSYLRGRNFRRYAFVIEKLGLKDSYAKQERYDKYRTGSRLGVPAQPIQRYGNR